MRFQEVVERVEGVEGLPPSRSTVPLTRSPARLMLEKLLSERPGHWFRVQLPADRVHGLSIGPEYQQAIRKDADGSVWLYMRRRAESVEATPLFDQMGGGSGVV